MWARVVEILVGVWLCFSPFIFGVPDDTTMWIDFGLAAAVAILASLSYYYPLRYIHLLSLLVALFLILWGRFAEASPPPPYHQNHISVGIFLLMIAIIPNHASLPDPVWYPSNVTPPRDV